MPTVALKSTPLLLMTAMCLYRSGLGGRGTAQPCHWTQQGFLFGGIVTVHMHEAVVKSPVLTPLHKLETACRTRLRGI